MACEYDQVEPTMEAGTAAAPLTLTETVSVVPATETGTARTVTSRLFQAAVECGKRVRSETALGTRPTSVPGVALSIVGRVFETLGEGTDTEQAKSQILAAVRQLERER